LQSKFFIGKELAYTVTKYLDYRSIILMGVLDMQLRCMLCGKIIEEELVTKPDPLDDDYDDEYEDELPKKKPLAVCLMCQAKLKHEADESQKIPKPM
jgi:hypothetical protein